MKILMLIDSLDIGGAETHVEILCRKLNKMGHNIVVASSGGIISQRLKKYGIKHILLPKIQKSTKNAYNLRSISQIFALSRTILSVIEQENSDIVHAHTRRMAFFAQHFCKKHKIPLIVTAHAKFDMKFPKKHLSKWGDCTIAVSEDIKKHLVYYGTPKQKIEVITNGVVLPKIELYFEQNKAQKENENAKNSFCQPT